MSFIDRLFRKPAYDFYLFSLITEWIVWINREQELKFKKNTIKTSKYTVYNFLFKSVLAHFKQPLYLYFLLVAFLQCCPSISSTHGIPTISLPLFITIILDSIKDGYEDYQRHVSDRAENNRIVYYVPKDYVPQSATSELSSEMLGLGRKKHINIETLSSLNLKSKLSSQIEVGDIILILNRDEIPADVVLLTTSESHGAAYIETICLDGETNLKHKDSLAVSNRILTEDIKTVLDKVTNWKASVLCNLPNNDLTRFEGTLTLFKYENEVNDNDDRNKHKISLNNILMRGCILRNTVWALGLVVYTGHDTKIYMNMSPPRMKGSNIDKLINRMILIIFAFQNVLALVAAFFNLYYYTESHEITYEYLAHLYRNTSYIRFFVKSYLNWLLLTSNIMPICAPVTVNVVRFIQGYFISVDKSMASPDKSTYSIARNTNLNDLLGQVQICFSDKTGTLTCNKMDFRKFAIEGISFGKGISDIRANYLSKIGVSVPSSVEGKYIIVNDYVNFVDDRLMDDLRNVKSPLHVPLIEFFIHIAVNNGVVTEYDDDNSFVYSSASPDESTFAYAAKSFGVILVENNKVYTLLDILGKLVRVKILVNFEFDNERKRSTVICAIPKGNSVIDFDKPIEEMIKNCRIILFTKGADNVVLGLVKKRDIDDKTLKYLNEYCNDGLRAICFAKKELDMDCFLEWHSRYHKALVSSDDSYKECAKLIDELEFDMHFQGVTGVEDKLQDGVPDTVESLTKAGIQPWMLTGDNLTSAMNIGLATNFIHLDSEKVDLTFINVENQMKKTNRTAEDVYKDLMEYYCSRLSTIVFNTHTCLLIDGNSIKFLVENEAFRPYFIKVCGMVHSAICARLTPSNKGDIVSLFNDEHKLITLAIGDGANDCNMIQKADVGVGIKGNEGAQAFNVSDYGISQFKFLLHLLLFHGRLTYRRMSKLIVYMIYKNLLLIVPIWSYGFFSMFSGQPIYFDLMQHLYNLFFTSIPIIIFGAIDQDVDKNLTFKYPQLYKLGQIGFYFNYYIFFTTIINAFVQAVIITSISIFAFGGSNIPSNTGETYNVFDIGYAIFTIVFVVATIKLLLETYYFNLLTGIGLFVSLFGYIYVSNSFSLSPKFGFLILSTVYKTNSDLRFWIFCLVAIAACLYRDYVWKVYLYSYRSRIYHSIQKAEY